MRRRQRPDADPFAVLGLTSSAGAADVIEARRRLAKSLHPDVGGSVAEMQRINAATQGALALIGGTENEVGKVEQPYGASSGSVRRDHPSFTVEALPVETFEGLLVVAAWLGDVITDDPPYVLEVALVDPVRGWCRLDLVPDAGASTVSITVAAEPGWPLPAVVDVRDLWIDGLNRLDWTGLDERAAGPSGPTP